ncbi:Wadjet anti-phage system protein JetD domain-containing protein [Mycobacterium sp. 155]|uniref:Wadjet anti-phage system protein JetD domain-containing protein n=1 Tax=Mycobacterium sp. 155 TaxID=1157943 RepID=UPI0003A2AB55|nr:Wadjet anti-phage system protein JetD domain-containing protein [Mycobacterium sp. 155]
MIRQLPIPGVDTKWLGTHRAAVISLVVPLGIPGHLGLRERDLLRAIAILDPTLRQGLPRLVAASDRELSALNLAPPRVLVVENLQTLEALPDLPDTVAVFRWGGHALAVADFPWVRGAKHVLYWGDLDTDGFAILARSVRDVPARACSWTALPWQAGVISRCHTQPSNTWTPLC